MDQHGTWCRPHDVIGVAGLPLMPATYGTEMLVNPGTWQARLLHAGRNETSAQNINIIFHFLPAIFTKHLVSPLPCQIITNKALILDKRFLQLTAAANGKN